MKSNNWRKGIYIDAITRVAVDTCNRKKKDPRHRHKCFANCTKYTCYHKDTGYLTTAIQFNNGVVYVGDDVWRKSNNADFCEYRYETYSSLESAKEEYIFKEPYVNKIQEREV